MSKPKSVKFELIPQTDDGQETQPYQIMREIREAYHPDLNEARIVLAWRRAIKPDPDGHLVLGKCKKTSDLDREVAPYDFIILLNQEVWNDPEFTNEKKHALIDHELCHADVTLDKNLDVKRDDRNRIVWRSKKHDIEEFYAIVERHGCYKRDLEQFAETLLKKRSQSKKEE